MKTTLLISLSPQNTFISITALYCSSNPPFINCTDMKIINILGREGVDAVYHSYHSYHANRSQGRRKSESYCWRRRFFCAAFLFSTSHKSVCSVKIPRHVLPFESLVWLEFHARGWIVLPNQVALTVSVRSLKLQFHCGKTTLSHNPRIPKGDSNNWVRHTTGGGFPFDSSRE